MELSVIQNELLSILSSSLFEHQYHCEATDYKAVYDEAKIQAVPVLIVDQLSQDVRASWMTDIYRIITNNMRVRYEHIEVTEYLAKYGIECVTFKGYTSAMYYPEMSYRSMGDVDFLIRKKDIEQARKVFEQDGWVSKNNEHPFEVPYVKENKTWELHWEVGGYPLDSAAAKFLDDIFEYKREIKCEEGTFYVPSEFHHGLILLVHAASHMTTAGIGLRHLCDWAVFADKVDVSQWKNELKECGLWRFAQLLTQVSVKYLKLKEQAWAMESVDEDLLKQMILDILDSGNFGNKDRGRLNQAKLMTSNGTVDDKSMLKNLMILLNNKAVIAMPFCEKHIWARPFGCIYVAIRHLFRVKQGTRPDINISDMIRGAKSRKEIYKMYHLYEVEKSEAKR